MSLPCPQRDALESVYSQSSPWPKDQALKLSPNTKFTLVSGETIHFLGVSNGASMRDDPDLHIAVFGRNPPRTGQLDNTDMRLLAKCRFGGLISGPDDDEWHWAEGLDVVSTDKAVELRLNGHRAQYRPI